MIKMNKPILFFVGMVLALNSMGQQVAPTEPAATVAPTVTEPKVAVTLGFLNGGGAIVGADFEFMLTERVSLQLGAGLPSFGAGINYHLKPGIRSSMINLGYWHQGIGETYFQSVLGPSYVFRARKLFTAQIGLGYLLEEGPAWPTDRVHPSVMLLYSIGIYLPVK
jgi:hypothetical protein